MSFILIYITNPNLKQAKKLCSYLLKNKLIACVNYFPIKSQFWWKGKIENTKEIVSILKAKKSNWNEIKQKVKKMHPYKTPCIIRLNAEADKDYEKWLNSV